MRTLALAIMGMLIVGTGYAQWTQLGSDIDGKAEGGHGGLLVSLSVDGNIVAIGEAYSDINGNDSGQVRIYQWNGIQWIQRGNDIDGEAEEDKSGGAVSLSADGTIVAIGAKDNSNTNGDRSGHVRIYQWDGAEWIQLGSDIDGESRDDDSGSALSLSANGTVIAIGAPYDSTNGVVRIYEWNETEWTQRGNDIDGEMAWSLSGYSGASVSLSSNGTIVAIGAPRNRGFSGNNSGHVRIYQWNGTTWTQLGDDIDGEAAEDESGSSVSLSADGAVVAIGAHGNNGNGSNSGHVRIYQYDGNGWVQRGNDIDGETAGDMAPSHSGGIESSASLSLSADGNTVAIGAFLNDGNGDQSGHVRVFYWTERVQQWVLRGNIYGKATGNRSGYSVSLSADGNIVASGASYNESYFPESTEVRIYQDIVGRATAQQDQISQQQSLVADLQAQVTNISLTQGPQGPQGKVGATGADADCVACADVANGAVDLACLVLGENIPTNYAQTQAAATVIVNTLLISTNICELACDIGAEIDTLINAKMNP